MPDSRSILKCRESGRKWTVTSNKLWLVFPELSCKLKREEPQLTRGLVPNNKVTLHQLVNDYKEQLKVKGIHVPLFKSRISLYNTWMWFYSWTTCEASGRHLTLNHFKVKKLLKSFPWMQVQLILIRICFPLPWSESRSVLRDQLDHGTCTSRQSVIHPNHRFIGLPLM